MPTNKGFAALAPTVFIGGLILAIGSGIALRSREQVLTDIGNGHAEQAIAQANACAEIAIGKLQTILGYAGNESIDSNGILCDILPITGTGNYDRVITARATVKNRIKTVSVSITKISSPTVIASWKEL